MEILIYIGAGLLLLFIANFFLEIGVSIILSAVISLISALVIFGGYGTGLFTGEIGFFDEPLYAISLAASAITILLVWFLEGMNLVILLVIWLLFQLLSASTIFASATGITEFFYSDEEAVEGGSK